MAKVKQKAFHPGTKRVGGKAREFTRDELKAYADGTNSAILAGVPVPLLKKHASLAADDMATTQFAATDGAGWLEGVQFDPVDGSLTWEMDVPPEIEKGIADKTIKFTSPEFRPHYKPSNPAIAFEGPMIRHVAFTPAPRDPIGQGAFEAIAMSEDAIQCSDDDFPPKKDGDGDGKSGEGDKSGAETPPEAPPKNPDMPPDANAKTKNQALVACISQMGGELPSDFDISAENAMDLLLAVFKTLAKSKAESEATEKPADPQLKEEQPMTFSEEELVKLPANVQAVIRRNAELERLAVQFSEDKKAAVKEKSIAAVQSAKLPAGLKKQLAERLEAVQFSESAELPTLTITEAAALFAAAIPKHLQFDEGDTTEQGHQDKEFFKVPGEARSADETTSLLDQIDRELGYPTKKPATAAA